MFETASVSQDGRRRYATANGIAFEAKPTGDGTWHGYPIPWESVPAKTREEWIDAGKVSRRDLRIIRPEHKEDIHWALKSDAS